MPKLRRIFSLVSRHLRHLPRRELAVDVLGEALAALGEALDLVGDVGRRVVLHVAQLVDFGFQLGDRLLELEEGGLHWRAILTLYNHLVAPERLAPVQGLVGAGQNGGRRLVPAVLRDPYGHRKAATSATTPEVPSIATCHGRKSRNAHTSS